MNVGIGYDVHRLASGEALVLGGVRIPSEKGLIGWSDADVLTHAIIDALLGAAGLGDIGRYFPPGDPQYKGISSLVLLSKVRDMLSSRGWVTNNIDVTIVTEEPRLSDYAEQMCLNISRTLGIGSGLVNIKASTSEQLGFVGRGEGVVTWAVASIKKASGEDL